MGPSRPLLGVSAIYTVGTKSLLATYPTVVSTVLLSVHLPRAEGPVRGDVSECPPGALELSPLLGRQVGRPLHPGVEAGPSPAALDLLEAPAGPPGVGGWPAGVRARKR